MRRRRRGWRQVRVARVLGRSPCLLRGPGGPLRLSVPWARPIRVAHARRGPRSRPVEGKGDLPLGGPGPSAAVLPRSPQVLTLAFLTDWGMFMEDLYPLSGNGSLQGGLSQATLTPGLMKRSLIV